MDYLFGKKAPTTPPIEEKEKGPSFALPASWYRDPAMYALERRAIFSKHWLLITHESRLASPGAYHSYEMANFPFFLVRDRQNKIRGFHNVCRHRAFPVVTETEGKAQILACKYHGWSYGFDGHLAKAPKFDQVPGFDKSTQGLYPIHVHVDKRGLVWVNLEASETPSVPWGETFNTADAEPRLDNFNMDEYVFDHAWERTDTEFNWKTLIDNYNEVCPVPLSPYYLTVLQCPSLPLLPYSPPVSVVSQQRTHTLQCYHCQVSHPGIAAVTDLDNYNVENKAGQILHWAQEKPGLNTGMNFAPTFFFPNAAVSMTTHYWYFMRVTPVGPTRVRMMYEVFRHKDATDKQFKDMDDWFKQIEGEDIVLCNGAQRNLNAGTYVTGELHPSNEAVSVVP